MQQNLDVEREILMKMTDRDLLNACHLNSRNLNRVCNENFFHTIMKERYSESLFSESPSWRQRYLHTVKWVAKLQEDFGYKYQQESKKDNPATQYQILQKRGRNGIILAVQEGQLSLVKQYSEMRQPEDLDHVLNIALSEGQLEIVKYLLSIGVILPPTPLRKAIEGGNVELVKYLVGLGYELNSEEKEEKELWLTFASKNLEMMKYLTQNIAISSIQNYLRDTRVMSVAVAKYLKDYLQKIKYK